ncbi:MAG: hypothetical protein WB462_12980 [Solirubrobacterales bacterium]
MSAIDEFLKNNESFAEGFDQVTCRFRPPRRSRSLPAWTRG